METNPIRVCELLVDGSGHCSTPAYPTGTYSPPSHPAHWSAMGNDRQDEPVDALAGSTGSPPTPLAA